MNPQQSNLLTQKVVTVLGYFLVDTFQSTVIYKVVLVSEVLSPEALVSCHESCGGHVSSVWLVSWSLQFLESPNFLGRLHS